MDDLTQTYWIENIIETIEGEGMMTGHPVTIVRFVYPPFWEQTLKFKSVQTHKMRNPLTFIELVSIITSSSNKYIHYMGEELCFQDVQPLFNAVRNSAQQRFQILDTNGIVEVGGLDWISLGPKPFQHIDITMLSQASEYRLYWSRGNTIDWEENIYRVWNSPYRNLTSPFTIYPKTPDDIQGTFDFVKVHSQMRVHVPLYMIYPEIDQNAKYLFGGKNEALEGKERLSVLQPG